MSLIEEKQRVPAVKHEIRIEDMAVLFTKDIFVGAVVGAIAKTIAAPLERTKIILQLQTSQTTLASEKRYKGIWDCLVRLPKDQGMLSYWRGNAVNCARSSSQESLGMAFKNMYKNFLVNGIDHSQNPVQHLIGNLLAGAFAGSTGLCIFYPLDMVRTRLAIDMGKAKTDREFKGMTDCIVKIVRHDGVPGLYKALVPSLQYMFIYRGCYYGLFDGCKPYFAKDGKDLDFFRAFVLGQTVTIIAQYTSYPLDTIRRRLMMLAGKKEGVLPFKGTISCTMHIWKSEGWRAFYSGALANAARGVSAALFLAMYNEWAKYM